MDYQIEQRAVRNKKPQKLSDNEYLKRFGYSREDYAQMCQKQIEDDKKYRADPHNCPVFAGHF